MIVCDRCGSEIKRVSDETKKCITVYKAWGAYIGKYVDLCDECQRELERLVGRAQSYFMVNKEKPSEIFDDVIFYDKNL